MAVLNVDHINPFLMASTKVLKEMCQVEVSMGKPNVKNPAFFEDTLIILIGLTGAMRGQAMIAFENSIACDIATKMIMMPITEMDDLAKSAICELGNMIMGNTATVFSTKGIAIDITPPTLATGSMSISTNYASNICIPLTYEGNKTIEIYIAIKGD